jgi:transposase
MAFIGPNFGLVPKQNSSGGKQNLLGISKRGDKYMRTMLIHGARAAVGHNKDLKGESPKKGLNGCRN